MTWEEYRNNDMWEQEQLDVARALLEDATRDTVLWLQANPSAEEKTHVLATQGRLADLAKIIERRTERRKEPRDDWQWSEGVREVLSQLLKAREARGGVVGESWDRLAKRLTRELPDARPRHRVPPPIQPVRSFSPPRSREDQATEIPPNPPTNFPGDLWPQTSLILLEAHREFPFQTHTPELCKRVITKMTPVFVEAVRAGKMSGNAVLTEHLGGMADLLHSLLVYNDPGRPASGSSSISNEAYRLGQEIKKSDEWLALTKAIVQAKEGQDSIGARLPKLELRDVRLTERREHNLRSGLVEQGIEPTSDVLASFTQNSGETTQRRKIRLTEKSRNPVGRPRKDEERESVRKLKAKNHTWKEIAAKMNTETRQEKTPEAYRALLRSLPARTKPPGKNGRN